MKKTLAALLLLASLPVYGGEIKIHLASYHMTDRAYLAQHHARNEVNPGLAYSTGVYEVCAYVNSESHVSPYVMRHFPVSGISVDLGLVGGYKSAPVLPMIGVSARISNVQIGMIAGAATNGRFIPIMTLSLVY